MTTLRTFIALELPATTRDALAAVQEDLRTRSIVKHLPTGSALKWVDPDGIHLTLKFLGNVDEESVPELATVVEFAATGFAPIALRLTRLGAFPNQRQPRVLWMGIDGQVDLVRQLQQRVEDGVASLGFVSERKPFSPHLTLARVRERATPQDRQAVADLLTFDTKAHEVVFSSENLSLIKSELHPSGARYQPLHTARLL